jgi:hypothetical protein
MSESRGGAIYHCVYKHEKFNTAAKGLYSLVRKAIEFSPVGPRQLYLDIDGHRNNQGEWDVDMTDLAHFIMDVLGDFLSEFTIPNPDTKKGFLRIKNTKPLRNDFPKGELQIQGEDC